MSEQQSHERFDITIKNVEIFDRTQESMVWLNRHYGYIGLDSNDPDITITPHREPEDIIEAQEAGGTVNTPDLEAIREYVDSATKGPWEIECNDTSCGPDHCGCEVPLVNAVGPIHSDEQGLCIHHQDAEFISRARTDMPKLLDEITRLRDFIEWIALKTAIDVRPGMDGIHARTRAVLMEGAHVQNRKEVKLWDGYR